MLLTPEQLERACGFLILNEFNAFSYCCKSCISEFDSGADLEAHVLLEHQDTKNGVEDIYDSANDVFDSDEPWNDTDQQLMTVDEIKQEIVAEPMLLQEQFHEYSYQSTTDNGILGIFVNDLAIKNELIEASADEPQNHRPKRKIQSNTTKKLENTVQAELQLDPNKYHCELCPFTEVNFIRKADILRHLRQHFAIKKECPVCKETTSYLHIHMKEIHPGINPYKCTYCKRTCKSQSLFEKHLRTHTGERPYLCSTCGNTFKDSSALLGHIERIHTRNKEHPYTCKECDIQFLYGTQYEKHRLEKHDDNRPHACNICGNRFRNKEKLRRHKLIHDEKRFPCKYCGKKFQTGDVKRLHERKMHEEVNWKKKKDNTAKKHTTVNQQMDSDQNEWNQQEGTSGDWYMPNN